MRLRAGTSGFSYKKWKGPFYPEKLPAKDMLGYYAERLSTVEINNTFYRVPKRDMLEGWAGKVPDDGAAPELVPTTDWGYLRLRREAYTDDDLRTWKAAIEAQPWREAFVFFRHEDEGAAPLLARRLLALD